MNYSNQYKIKVEDSCLYYTENDVHYFYPVNEFKVKLKKYFAEGKKSVGIEFRAFQIYMVVMESHPCFKGILEGLMDEFGLGRMTINGMLSSDTDVPLFYVARHNAKRVFQYLPGMPQVPYRGFPPVVNGLLVPYQAKKETLMDLLHRPVAEYITALCVFAWQGTEESYEMLLQELKNKDYYKRRAALEYISMHPMWDNDSSLLRGLVLDRCEYTVLLSLKLIDRYKNTDMDEEVMEAYWTWNNHVEIQEQCFQYFTRCGITREQIRKHREKNQQIEQNATVEECYENTDIGQNTPWAAVKEEARYEDYKRIILKYRPQANREEIEQILQNLSKFGCGYASFINTVMRYYEDKPIEFFEKFGLRNQDHSGKSNGDDLIVIMYALCGMEPKGLTLTQLFININKFKKAYDIKVGVKLISNPLQYLEQKDTYVLIMTGNFSMVRDGKAPQKIKEYHFMNLLGITKQGDYEVISWGEKYILPKDSILGRVFLVSVTFENS